MAFIWSVSLERVRAVRANDELEVKRPLEAVVAVGEVVPGHLSPEPLELTREPLGQRAEAPLGAATGSDDGRPRHGRRRQLAAEAVGVERAVAEHGLQVAAG